MRGEWPQGVAKSLQHRTAPVQYGTPTCLPCTFSAAGNDDVEGRRELRAGALCSRRAHTGRTRHADERCRRGCPHMSGSLPRAEPLLCAAGLAPLAVTPAAGACHGCVCRPSVRTGNRLRDSTHVHKQGSPSDLMQPPLRVASVYAGWLMCVGSAAAESKDLPGARTCHPTFW